MISVLGKVFNILISFCILFLSFLGYSTDTSAASIVNIVPSLMKESVLPVELSKRLETYWNYRSVKNFEESYKIEALHTRHQIEYDKYVKMFGKGMTIKSVELINSDCNGERCYELLVIEFLISSETSYTNKKSEHTQRIKDYWIEQDGKWYHVIRDTLRKIY